MSKFVRAKGEESSSEEQSESEEKSESGEDERRFTRFDFGSSSNSDDEKPRVIRTARDKMMEAYKNVLKEVRNHIKINDFAAMQEDFINLNQQLTKWKYVEELPMVYIKGLVLMDDHVNDGSLGKLSTVQGRACKTLKNKLKKHNKEFEEKIEEYRKNPIESEAEEESKEEEKEEEESEEQEVSSSGEESSSEEEVERSTPEERRKRWVKKVKVEEKKQEDNKQEDESKIKPDVGHVHEVEFKETVVRDKEELKFEFTDPNIKAYLIKINEKRGRSGYDPLLYVKHLNTLMAHVRDYELKVDTLVSLIKVRFEATQIVGESVMTLEYWKDTCKNMCTLLEVLQERPEYLIKEGKVEAARQVSEEEEEEGEFKAQANIVSYLELLDGFLTSGTKSEEPRSTAYVNWLRNEVNLLSLAEDMMKYYQRASVIQAQVRIALVILDRLHYKHDNLLRAMREKGNVVTHKEYFLEEKMEEKIAGLAALVYEHGESRLKLKAVLYQIQHHCIHGRFHEARELFLYSRLNQQQFLDVQLQILYNRALVQLGLAAFHRGYIEKVLEFLNDIISTNRLRELLAQSISTRKDKSTKQEMDEKKRLLPYHAHISIDWVEAVYLISAMVIEVPFVSKHKHNLSEHATSRFFRKVMQEFERKNVLGIPSESVREQLARAAHRLHEGDWKACFATIAGLRVWNLQSAYKEKMLEFVKGKIREAAVLAYVYNSQSNFEAYSIENLHKMFELEEEEIVKLLSREILEGKIRASIDPERNTLSLVEKEPTQTQYLAESLAEKVTRMVDNNERMQDVLKSGKEKEAGRRQLWNSLNLGKPSYFIPSYHRSLESHKSADKDNP